MDGTLVSIPSTVVIHICTTWEMEVEGSEVQSQPLLYSKSKASLDYVRACPGRKENKSKAAQGGGSEEKKEGKKKNIAVL